MGKIKKLTNKIYFIIIYNRNIKTNEMFMRGEELYEVSYTK
jgi:hypothetical protein